MVVGKGVGDGEERSGGVGGENGGGVGGVYGGPREEEETLSLALCWLQNEEEEEE